MSWTRAGGCSERLKQCAALGVCSHCFFPALDWRLVLPVLNLKPEIGLDFRWFSAHTVKCSCYLTLINLLCRYSRFVAVCGAVVSFYLRGKKGTDAILDWAVCSKSDSARTGGSCRGGTLLELTMRRTEGDRRGMALLGQV